MSFQAPKGTRDFLPADMAVRRHVESMWRSTATAHGFDEIDGPTFEHLALYTVKSGDEIVSDRFSFRRAGGDDDYALRPEFTPTLARIVAARGAQFPKPMRWFSIASMFRAERPQRGRLREHIQWNCDVIGDASPRAEADIIAAAVHLLERLGLGPDQIRIKISHRDLIARLLTDIGAVPEDRLVPALSVLDRRLKVPADVFRTRCTEAGIAPSGIDAYLELAGSPRPGQMLTAEPAELLGSALAACAKDDPAVAHTRELGALLDAAGLLPWCEVDFGIVRGLAYYTGTVFEIHEATGAERAIAGGGRYDRLVELLGGPATPAMGFAMGDVVIRLVLEECGLLAAPETYLPRPDAFLIDLRGNPATAAALAMRLRRAGMHVRLSGRSSTNVGKLLADANRQRARCAVILGAEFDEGLLTIKDLERGAQEQTAVSDVETSLARMLGP